MLSPAQTVAAARPNRGRSPVPLAPAALAAALEEFLTLHPKAAVVEEGAVLFEMAQTRFSVQTSSGRCVLQLWSEQRNLVRTVLSLEERKDALRIEVQRFGQARPQVLRLVADRDQRTPSARAAVRTRYLQLLQRVLHRCFTDWKQGELYASADLEHSFGPACVRGLLERGQAAWAVVAINADETPSSVDGMATVAVLWLEHCRERSGGRRLVEGVKVIVPVGMGATVRARMAWLNPAVAKWELYELDQQHEEMVAVSVEVDGNFESHLSSAFRADLALDRCRGGVEQVLGLLGEEARALTEVEPRSPTEISLRLHGLEFARVQHGLAAGSFARQDCVSFGAGANETPLNEETGALFSELAARLFEGRQVAGSMRNPLYRLQPERWLEARLRREIADVEPQIRPQPVYTQVPALASADRGMLDLLAVTRSGRLAVLELKAGEDLHLPFQGLDYWMRVRALHRAGEFVRAGYFPGIELSTATPILYFVVPSLRLHSTFDTLMKHMAPEVEWKLIALDESWRKRLRVVFRKHGGTGKAMVR
ncbi:MAG TPA: hypothetical protein VGD62_13715 [Acidobacteriaceae bacterium]